MYLKLQKKCSSVFNSVDGRVPHVKDVCTPKSRTSCQVVPFKTFLFSLSLLIFFNFFYLFAISLASSAVTVILKLLLI